MLNEAHFADSAYLVATYLLSVVQVGESVCTDTKILQAVVDTLKETIGKESFYLLVDCEVTSYCSRPTLISVSTGCCSKLLLRWCSHRQCSTLRFSLQFPMWISSGGSLEYVFLDVGKSKPDFVRAATCCMVLVRLLGSKPCFEAVRTSPEISTILFQVSHSLILNSSAMLTTMRCLRLIMFINILRSR